MHFNDLDARIIKERVDMAQLWSAWLEADQLRRHSFLGSLDWEERSGKSYLYSRKRGVVKSLGPQSPETEAMREAFRSGKEENKTRLDSLSREMERQASVLKSLGAGRLPFMAARVLRSLASQDRLSPPRVIGTNALYAYEALAGVRFDASSTATGDIDILIDDRNRLKILSEERESLGLIRMIQEQVDRSFRTRGPRDFRMTNDKGYMIEFVRPEPRPAHRVMPGAAPVTEGDVEPAPVIGLQWLVNAPAVEAVVIDERGFPAPMRCPDPRFWSVHKLWLSSREDRDPEKKLRDAEQGRLVLKLVEERLAHLPLDEEFRAMLPGELRGHLPVPKSESADRRRPNW